ncbi:hypothetical protein [Shewanella ulleungensis]|uniref:Methylamine utilization protein n=1 Tax=Shewanella ulleungensis TaxID=2282699 RepID=A0ABQ2QQX8_9GAMM|nr:hypothetical protein [Shewanella ulleungensis]MCL1151671.1 hypothetical protein [Shewanella ulleungensis]GGP90321.1 hypothetical protein GCM10009410_25460 [Shewanella ulleungensis]
MIGLSLSRDKSKLSLTLLLNLTTLLLLTQQVTQTVSAQEFLILNQQGQAAVNVVVYLQPSNAENRIVAAESVKAEVHQKDKQFSPYITVVQKGQEVAFVNEDDITHHIYSALGPKRFSFKLRHEQAKQLIMFETAGHVSMGCNIHDWMSGHLLVVDTPFYAITDNQGKVIFNALPEDDFSVVVWHPQLKLKDNQQLQTFHLPSEQSKVITLDAEFDSIPKQQSLDEFEFLEGY